MRGREYRRSIQAGAGGAFSLVGAAYLINKNFPASMAASFIGATQMFGMAGGSAGQFAVGPLISQGLPWSQFWIYAGVIGLAIGACLFFFLLVDAPPGGRPARGGWALLRALRARSARSSRRTRQSIICGLISGLLFIPTTIFTMTWGVRFLQEARGRE